LSAAHKKRNAQIKRNQKKKTSDAKLAIENRDRPEQQRLDSKQAEAVQAFREREATIGGKVQNVFNAIRSIEENADTKSLKDKFGEAWGYVASERRRFLQMRKDQAREKRIFRRRQREEFTTEKEAIAQDADKLKQKNIDRFYA